MVRSGLNTSSRPTCTQWSSVSTSFCLLCTTGLVALMAAISASEEEKKKNEDGGQDLPLIYGKDLRVTMLLV